MPMRKKLKMIKTIAKDHEEIITIQEKIIKAHEETIKKEKLINKLLYDRYLDVMTDNGNWFWCYQKLNKKWVAAGIYASKYKEEKIMKGRKSEKKNKRGSKTK